MSNSLSFYTDMRMATRIRSRIKVRYQIIAADGTVEPVRETMVRDISVRGMQVLLDRSISLDAKVQVEFQLPRIEQDVVIVCRVIRVEEVSSQGYRIGLLFEDIKNDNKDVILSRIDSLDLVKLLYTTAQQKASDLHLTYGQPPILRLHGRLIPLETDPLSAPELRDMIYSILSDEQISRFEKFRELDFAFSPNPELRFRVNLHFQRGNAEGTFRLILPEVKSMHELGLPSVVEDLALLKKGLVVIAGPTGSGKTTTLAAMVDIINHQREAVIICLEDPIEYLHKKVHSIIKQREIGTDTLSFSVSLKKTLRQDPDVIMVGELLDPETVRTAITAAETGHLVLTSLHAPDTMQAIDRLISIFPPQQRHQACVQLASCLQGVITQFLVPKKDREHRVIATEVMVATDAIRNLIREGQTVQIPSLIQTGARFKMHTMAESLKRLFHNKIITRETAIDYCAELSQILT